MPESPYPLVPIADALRIVMDRTPVLEPRSTPLRDARGRVLAEGVRSAEPFPAIATSTMDGYAVRASDGWISRSVVGEQPAGEPRGLRVGPGEAVWITTGAPLPDGADTVVPVEMAENRNGQVYLTQQPQPGHNLRKPGDDIAAGQLVVTAGTVLGPPELGLLATVGAAQVLVYPPPKVAIISTGDELVALEDTPAPGQVRDSNRVALAAAVAETGAVAIDLGAVSDDWDALVTRLSDALDRADVVITSGGVSMGDKDLVKPLLEQRGQVHFGRVDARPGKPVTFATVRRPMTETTTAADAQMTPVFALPGNPVSSLVSFELLVRPALLKMQGHRSLLRPMGRVKLQHDVTCAPDKVEFQRAVVSVHAAGLVASTTGRQASSRLLSMVGANALLRVPPSDVVLEAGSEVEALLLGPVVVPAPQPRSASGLPGADRAE